LAASAHHKRSALPDTIPPSTGRTFYVALDGRNRNPGTREQPWRTIQKALNTLRPGQRALVLAGTYTENLAFRRAGRRRAPITVAANPGDTVILHAASPIEGNWYPVQISGSYFRLHGFVIENGRGTSDANVYLQEGANHVEVSGNEIRNGQDSGIFTDSATSYIYLLRNRIHDNGLNHQPGQHQSHGIYLEGSHDLVANNVIYNHAYGFGIQIYPANHDTVVTDNTIAASDASSIVVGGSDGVYNIMIRNNILYGGNYGVEMDSACPTHTVTVDHNVIYAYNESAVDRECSAVDVNGGNISANPRFVDYGARNLRLRARSPAIGAALGAWSEPTDVDGRKREQGRSDIGAYER
jgi:hypothetical protein